MITVTISGHFSVFQKKNVILISENSARFMSGGPNVLRVAQFNCVSLDLKEIDLNVKNKKYVTKQKTIAPGVYLIPPLLFILHIVDFLSFSSLIRDKRKLKH